MSELVQYRTDTILLNEEDARPLCVCVIIVPYGATLRKTEECNADRSPCIWLNWPGVNAMYHDVSRLGDWGTVLLVLPAPDNINA